MKVGILCYPSSGGSGVVASELGAALASRGHDVHVLSYRLPFRMRPVPDRFQFHEIGIPRYPLFEFPSYGMAAAAALAEAAGAHRLDILHAHYAFPHGVSAFLAKEMLDGDPPAKSVTTLHGTDVVLVESEGSLNAPTKLGIVRSDAVTAVSESLRRRTLSWFGISTP